MTDRFVLHSSYTLERAYPAEPARVFAAWADPATKARWFGGENAERHDLDFRVGGLETTRGHDADGRALTFESRYHDIVTGERIVYSSTLRVQGTPVTASLTTVQFRPTATGTALLLHRAGRPPRRPREARVARERHRRAARHARQVARRTASA